MIKLYAALFFAQFTFVFLKAFQQRNVAFDKFFPVLPTSIAMAAMEVFTITKLAKAGWTLGVVLAVGFASGAGAMVAMKLHHRLFPNKEK